MLTKLILATLLTTAVSAGAAEYFVVVPLPAKQVALSGIKVALSAVPLPSGVVGVPYAGFDLHQALQVTGDPSYSGEVGWRVVNGALPPGIALNNGRLAGTPTQAGDAAFTVRATYKTRTGEQAYRIVSFAVTVGLTSAALPQGVVGVPYPTYDLKPHLMVQGDPNFTPADVTWAVVSNSLPAGLYLTSGGVITGTPTVAGAGAIQVRASYKGVRGEQTYQVVAVNIAVGLAPAALPESYVGTAYSYDFRQLASVTGDPAYDASLLTFRAADGSTVPAGLNLSATGMLSGSPVVEAAGINFSLVAAYRGKEASRQYSMQVRPAFFVFNPTISTSTAQYNLRAAATAAGWNGTRPLKATVTIARGVNVGSASTSGYAFDTGSGFPSGSVLTLTNLGTVVGMGGAGGAAAANGAPGGPAVHAQYPLAVTNDGTIAGGGGGGGGSLTVTESNVLAGGAGGGGGQGYGASAGGERAAAFAGAQYPYAESGGEGSLTAPGAGGAGVQSGFYPKQWEAPWHAASGAGGAGGALGQPGAASEAGWGAGSGYRVPGGAAGYAVVGASNVTWLKRGDVLGPTQ